MNDYECIIGLEIHAQLSTDSKFILIPKGGAAPTDQNPKRSVGAFGKVSLKFETGLESEDAPYFAH